MTLPALASKKDNYNSIDELSADLREIFKNNLPKISSYVRDSWPANNSDRTDEELFVGTNCKQTSEVFQSVLQNYGYAPIIERTNRHNYLSIQANIKGTPTEIIIDPTWKQLFVNDVHKNLVESSRPATYSAIDKALVSMKANPLLVQERSNYRNFIESQEFIPIWKSKDSNDTFDDWYLKDPLKINPKNLLTNLNLNFDYIEKQYPENEVFWKEVREQLKTNGTEALLQLCDPRTSRDLYHSIYNTLSTYASKEAEELDELLKKNPKDLSFDDKYETLLLRSQIEDVERNVQDVALRIRIIKSRKAMVSHFRLTRKVLQNNSIQNDHIKKIESNLLNAKKRMNAFIDKTQFSDFTKNLLKKRVNDTKLVLPKSASANDIRKFRASIFIEMQKKKVDFNTVYLSKVNQDPSEHSLLDFSASGGEDPQISIGYLAGSSLYQDKFKIDYEAILNHELGHNTDPNFRGATLENQMPPEDIEIFKKVKQCMQNRYASNEIGKEKEHEDFADLIGNLSMKDPIESGLFSQQNIDDDLNETIRSLCAPVEEASNYAKEGTRKLRMFLDPSVRKAYSISAPIEKLIKEETCGDYFFNKKHNPSNIECIGEVAVPPVLNNNANKLINTTKNLH